MSDTVTIFDRLCEHFPAMPKAYLENVAYEIASDITDDDFVTGDYRDPYDAQPKEQPSEYYTRIIEELDIILDEASYHYKALNEGVRYAKEHLDKFVDGMCGLVETASENTAKSFLDRDLDDIMTDLILGRDEECNCGACRNARDTYTHVMD